MSEPEYITIVEGPTPDFRPVPERLFQSILEGPGDADVSLCEMRTMNGPDIVARCRAAWDEGRSVVLDYPDDMRMRKQVAVVSMRLDDWDAGMVLRLWIRLPVEQGEADEFDGLDGLDDLLR